MRIFFRYNVSFLFVATYVVAICFAKNLGGLTALLLIQPALIWLIVGLLYRYLPKSIRKASKENVYRVDGSRSAWRESQEAIAESQVRTHLYWVFIVVMLIGAWLALACDNLVSNHMTSVQLMFVGAVVLTWFIGSCYFVTYSYFRILKAFYLGIKLRNQVYLDFDIASVRSKFQSSPSDLATHLEGETETNVRDLDGPTLPNLDVVYRREDF